MGDCDSLVRSKPLSHLTTTSFPPLTLSCARDHMSSSIHVVLHGNPSRVHLSGQTLAPRYLLRSSSRQMGPPVVSFTSMSSNAARGLRSLSYRRCILTLTSKTLDCWCRMSSGAAEAMLSATVDSVLIAPQVRRCTGMRNHRRSCRDCRLARCDILRNRSMQVGLIGMSGLFIFDPVCHTPATSLRTPPPCCLTCTVSVGSQASL